MLSLGLHKLRTHRFFLNENFSRIANTMRTVSQEDELIVRGANPRTGLISPFVRSETNLANISKDYIGHKYVSSPLSQVRNRRKSSGHWRANESSWSYVDSFPPTPSPDIPGALPRQDEAETIETVPFNAVFTNDQEAAPSSEDDVKHFRVPKISVVDEDFTEPPLSQERQEYMAKEVRATHRSNSGEKLQKIRRKAVGSPAGTKTRQTRNISLDERLKILPPEDSSQPAKRDAFQQIDFQRVPANRLGSIASFQSASHGQRTASLPVTPQKAFITSRSEGSLPPVSPIRKILDGSKNHKTSAPCSTTQTSADKSVHMGSTDPCSAYPLGSLPLNQSLPRVRLQHPSEFNHMDLFPSSCPPHPPRPATRRQGQGRHFLGSPPEKQQRIMPPSLRSGPEKRRAMENAAGIGSADPSSISSSAVPLSTFSPSSPGKRRPKIRRQDCGGVVIAGGNGVTKTGVDGLRSEVRGHQEFAGNCQQRQPLKVPDSLHVLQRDLHVRNIRNNDCAEGTAESAARAALLNNAIQATERNCFQEEAGILGKDIGLEKMNAKLISDSPTTLSLSTAPSNNKVLGFLPVQNLAIPKPVYGNTSPVQTGMQGEVFRKDVRLLPPSLSAIPSKIRPAHAQVRKDAERGTSVMGEVEDAGSKNLIIGLDRQRQQQKQLATNNTITTTHLSKPLTKSGINDKKSGVPSSSSSSSSPPSPQQPPSHHHFHLTLPTTFSIPIPLLPSLTHIITTLLNGYAGLRLLRCGSEAKISTHFRALKDILLAGVYLVALMHVLLLLVKVGDFGVECLRGVGYAVWHPGESVWYGLRWIFVG